MMRIAHIISFILLWIWKEKTIREHFILVCFVSFLSVYLDMFLKRQRQASLWVAPSVDMRTFSSFSIVACQLRRSDFQCRDNISSGWATETISRGIAGRKLNGGHRSNSHRPSWIIPHDNVIVNIMCQLSYRYQFWYLKVFEGCSV